mgnify:CR=1 FL=1
MSRPEFQVTKPSGLRRLLPALELVTAYTTFATLGLSVGFRGVAWPSIRSTFGLPLDAVGTWLLAITIGSILSSFNGGYVASVVGMGRLLAVSGLATAVGLLGCGLAPAWLWMILAGLVSGLGSGAMHAGLNAHFAAHLGPRALNWVHACFGVGATVGPWAMSSILTAGWSWRWAYAAAGAWMILLVIGFTLTLSRWGGSSDQRMRIRETSAATEERRETFKLPIVWLSLLLFFSYTGVESTAGQWAYSLFTEARSVPEATAGLWMTIYWGGLAAGRLLLGSVVERLGPVSLIRLASLSVAVGAGLIWWHATDVLSFLGLALMGLAEGPIFPSLVSVTPRRVSAGHVDKAIGFQVAAASLGSAVLSGLAGVLAERTTLEIVGPFLLFWSAAIIALHEFTLRLARDGRRREATP